MCSAQKTYKEKKKGSGHGHFCLLSSPIFSIWFSLYFGEKTFWWVRGENTWTHNLFSFLPTQPNTLKNILLPIFYQKFFIHHISPPNKHTLKGLGPNTWLNTMAQLTHRSKRVAKQTSNTFNVFRLILFIYIWDCCPNTLFSLANLRR